jgi:hypothetical protein
MLEPLNSSARFGTTVLENLTVLINLDYSAMGRTPKEVAAAVRHVCGIPLTDDKLPPLNVDNFYETVQQYYARFKQDDPSGRNAKIFLCYFSSYFHELRHVHDLIGSRSGQLIFYNAFRVSQNMPIILSRLWDWQKKNPDALIPLPLAPWLHLLPGLSEDVREAFKEWSKSGDTYHTFNQPDDLTPGGLTVAHLLETSAVNVQLDFVHDTLGNEAVQSLTSLIEEEGNSALYLQVRKELEEAFANMNYKGVGIGGLINYLIHVALNWTEAADDAQDRIAPVRYFEFLAEEIIQRIPAEGPQEFADVQRAVEDICREWGLASPKAMRLSTEKILAAHVETLRKRLVEEEDQDRPRLLQSRLDEFKAIQDQVEAFPECMTQRLYVWSLFYGRFPSVHVKVYSDGVAHDLMTKGVQITAVDDWIGSSTWGGVIRLLAEGMGKMHPEFFEEICYTVLIQGSVHGPGFRFFNPLLNGYILPMADGG